MIVVCPDCVVGENVDDERISEGKLAFEGAIWCDTLGCRGWTDKRYFWGNL